LLLLGVLVLLLLLLLLLRQDADSQLHELVVFTNRSSHAVA
jgi:hypothetical protein